MNNSTFEVKKYLHMYWVIILLSILYTGFIYLNNNHIIGKKDHSVGKYFLIYVSITRTDLGEPLRPTCFDIEKKNDGYKYFCGASIEINNEDGSELVVALCDPVDVSNKNYCKYAYMSYLDFIKNGEQLI